MKAPRWTWILCLAAAVLCLSAATASAADQIYWGNEDDESISHASVSGGGGSDIPITGVTVAHPQGLAIDSAAGKVYWVNRDGLDYSIRFANLDGSGGGILNTTGASVSEPHGLAIYPAGGRVYWANFTDPFIYFARLDGSGGGTLDTTGALVEQPVGLTVYPAQNRIYWANFDGGEHDIDFANLDGSGGGGTLDLSAATHLDMPRSIAIDGSNNRVYWANSSSPAITYVKGSEGGSVFTDGIETDNLQGFAIDPIAQRVFWGAPENDTLGFASIAEGGSLGLLDTTGATRDNPAWPVLLYVPRGTAAPTVTAFKSPTPRILRKPKPGRPLVPLVASHTATLDCAQGSWAGDLLESFLYRAPQRISYQWLRNERPIPGATTSSLVATEVGDYICRETASNAAGSTAQDSASVNIAASLRLGKAVLNAEKGIAKVPVGTSGTGVVALSGRGAKPNRLKSKPGSTAPLRGTLVLKARGKARKNLESNGEAKVRARIAYTPTNGSPLTRTRSFNLRLAAD
jgi:DNA-binding beta-propeller fold protein YncE